MDGESYLRFILALLLVLGLLALAAFLLRRSGLGPKMSRSRRLAALESLPLDPRHRLVLVRRDDVEHLLLLGPQGDLVVEGNIKAGSGGSAIASTSSYGRADQRPFADILGERTTSPASSPSPDQPTNRQN
jgi:flagellar protein FliO/FliZ